MHLRLDFCTHDAARYAVTHWHYSKSVPSGKLVKIGVWEDDQFKGCVIYSYGANRNLAKWFKLPQTQVCELTRVALRDHVTPVSKILSISLKLLHKQSPGIKVVVSYADTEQGHLGKIYQASNWLYVGPIQEGMQSAFIIHGRKMHPRTAGAKGWIQSLPWLKEHIDPNASLVRSTGKHKYLWFFDDELRKRFEPLKKKYPTCVASETSDTPCIRQGKGGAAPTATLKVKLKEKA